MKFHLKESSENSNKFEADIISLKTQLEEEKRVEEVIKTHVLKKEEDGIPSSQKSTCVEIGEAPCFEGTSSKPPKRKIDENPIIILQRKNQSEIKKEIEYVVVPISYVEKEKRAKPPPRKNVFKVSTTLRQDVSSRYPSLFSGYCFSCTNFGHKACDCKVYEKDDYQINYQYPRSKVVGTQDIYPNGFINIEYMSVSFPFRYHIE